VYWKLLVRVQASRQSTRCLPSANSLLVTGWQVPVGYSLRSTKVSTQNSRDATDEHECRHSGSRGLGDGKESGGGVGPRGVVRWNKEVVYRPGDPAKNPDVLYSPRGPSCDTAGNVVPMESMDSRCCGWMFAPFPVHSLLPSPGSCSRSSDCRTRFNGPASHVANLDIFFGRVRRGVEIYEGWWSSQKVGKQSQRGKGRAENAQAGTTPRALSRSTLSRPKISNSGYFPDRLSFLLL